MVATASRVRSADICFASTAFSLPEIQQSPGSFTLHIENVENHQAFRLSCDRDHIYNAVTGHRSKIGTTSRWYPNPSAMAFDI
jgi:hypothetical protein